VFTAFAGVHLRWHRMERYGSLRVPTDPATAELVDVPAPRR
jgi:hypothetical protein